MYLTVWVEIRHDSSQGLIWVELVCKGYQQTAPVSIELTTYHKAGNGVCSIFPPMA